MPLKFVACAHPSRSACGLTKTELYQQYLDWIKDLPDRFEQKKNVEEDVFIFSRMCALDVYTSMIVDSKKKIPLVMTIDKVKMRVAFTSKVIKHEE